MAGAAAKADPGKGFLQQIAAQNPLNEPLPPGVTADPTYLAFLRGAGYSYNQAWQTALQNMAAARASYDTQASRLPAQLQQTQEVTDQDAGNRGTYSSGQRLVEENRNTVANQQQGQDLVAARAAALQDAQSKLQVAISDLARQRADAIGGLQDRLTQRADQNRYIAAVANATRAASGGGGTITIGGSPQPPQPAQPAQPGQPGQTQPNSRAGAQPQQAPGQSINDYLSSKPVYDYVTRLASPDQANFVKFIQAQYPTANVAPVLLAINGQSPWDTSVGYGGAGHLS